MQRAGSGNVAAMTTQRGMTRGGPIARACLAALALIAADAARTSFADPVARKPPERSSNARPKTKPAQRPSEDTKRGAPCSEPGPCGYCDCPTPFLNGK
jgi:hypothetical protein